MARPEVQLLANGDFRAPEKGPTGDWSMSRFTPDQTGYADWLTFVQERDRSPSLLTRGLSFRLPGVLVVVGLFFGLALLGLLVAGRAD
jgi:hypothetical protein